MNKVYFTIIAVFMSLVVASSVSATEFYASPTGTSTGDGSIGNPWDLSTALAAKNTVKPGDTLNMRGGTYYGKFTSTLAGAQNNMITVRSYPGEWAILDGYVWTTLAAPLTNSSAQTNCTLTNGSKFRGGSQALVENEVIYFGNKVGNTYYDCERGWSGGIRPVAHSTGAVVVLTGVIFEVAGSDTVYRDFEVLNSYPIRENKNVSLPNEVVMIRGAGINVHGIRNKIVNTVVHDTMDGIDAWTSASDVEIYGNIIYNSGAVGTSRGHGHFLYQENQFGTRRIIDNIGFNSFDIGMQAYGVTGPFVGGHIEGNAFFNSGSPAMRGAATRVINVLIGTNSQSIPSVTFLNNYLFHPRGTSGGNLKLGYNVPDNTANLSGNYIGGGGNNAAVDINKWGNITFQNNTIFHDADLLLILGNRLAGGTYLVDNNVYYDRSQIQSCVGGGRRAPFAYTGASGGCGALDFNEWKSQTGFDTSSIYQQSLPPAAVFVRPNQYEQGRAHIIVYNWNSSNSVSVNLSSAQLISGQTYEIRNAQDYNGALVASGIFDASNSNVTISLVSPAALAVAAPIGYNFTPATTLPDFGVFVVKATSGSPTNTAPVVSAGVDQTIVGWTASLSGVVSDDGRPSNTLISSWSTVSGPGTASFGNVKSAVTSVTFSLVGTYVLRLTATDGSLSTADDVSIVVGPAPRLGDITGDGVVNILDLQLVSQNVGSSLTTYDLNTDGIVNIFDMMVVIKNWG